MPLKMSQLLVPTLRETPAEAEIPSHKLMLRAGLMRKAAAGIYTYLPLGQRVIRKVMQIVRDEMDRKDGQEVLLPIMQPAELWHESGRWADYGEEMLRLTDRHGREYCLGPTHEEIITALVRSEVRSYRQMPLLLYQIQNKYRDEIRPRFGVMRGREFIMKDAYSFDTSAEGLDQVYDRMYDAYSRVFERCGVTVRAVEADPGAIGGNDTHEFMVVADSGEAALVYCTACDFAANVEKADSVPVPVKSAGAGEVGPARAVETPAMRTIQEVSDFLAIEAHSLVKTLIYRAGEDRLVAALVRGDRELNEIKLAKALGVFRVDLADADTIQKVTGSPVGFAGPVGLSGVTIVADPEVMQMDAAVVGANEVDKHLVHVVPGRDFTADLEADLRMAGEGDPCPGCGAALESARGIEVGQIFKLGTKYSVALNANYLDENGTENPIVMGCYGIGVTRTVAAVIEQHHDDDGILWPMSVAPYHVAIVPIKTKDEEQMRVAQTLYEKLWEQSVETILDDRDERPGVKFKDADLIGFPLRITIGPRSLKEGAVELKIRHTGEEESLPIDDAAAIIAERVRSSIRRQVEGA